MLCDDQVLGHVFTIMELHRRFEKDQLAQSGTEVPHVRRRVTQI